MDKVVKVLKFFVFLKVERHPFHGSNNTPWLKNGIAYVKLLISLSRYDRYGISGLVLKFGFEVHAGVGGYYLNLSVPHHNS
jgi:hypothetical protein